MKHWIQSAVQAWAPNGKGGNGKTAKTNGGEVQEDEREPEPEPEPEPEYVPIEKPQLLRAYDEFAANRKSKSFEAVMEVWNEGVAQDSLSIRSSSSRYARQTTTPSNPLVRPASQNSKRRSASLSPKGLPPPLSTNNNPPGLRSNDLRRLENTQAKRTSVSSKRKSSSLSSIKESHYYPPSTQTNPGFQFPPTAISPLAPVRRTSQSSKRNPSSLSSLSSLSSTKEHPRPPSSTRQDAVPVPSHTNNPPRPENMTIRSRRTSKINKRKSTSLPYIDTSLAFDYNPAILSYVDSGRVQTARTLRRKNMSSVDTIFINDPEAPITIIVTTPDEESDLTPPSSPTTSQPRNSFNSTRALRKSPSKSRPPSLTIDDYTLPDRTRLMPPSELQPKASQREREGPKPNGNTDTNMNTKEVEQVGEFLSGFVHTKGEMDMCKVGSAVKMDERDEGIALDLEVGKDEDWKWRENLRGLGLGVGTPPPWKEGFSHHPSSPPRYYPPPFQNSRSSPSELYKAPPPFPPPPKVVPPSPPYTPTLRTPSVKRSYRMAQVLRKPSDRDVEKEVTWLGPMNSVHARASSAAAVVENELAWLGPMVSVHARASSAVEVGEKGGQQQRSTQEQKYQQQQPQNQRQTGQRMEIQKSRSSPDLRAQRTPVRVPAPIAARSGRGPELGGVGTGLGRNNSARGRYRDGRGLRVNRGG